MQIKEFIQRNTDNFITDLSGLIKIPSLKQPPLPGMPFGKDIYAALIYMNALCKRMGFYFHNLDSYAGYTDFGEGRADDAVGVLAHLDVVPAEGFLRDPFGAQIIDGKIYGRGAMDNKGPAMASLYALYALRESGFTPKRKIRLIFGCDEESGWGDIEYYKQHQPLPKTGFSPDGDYPVVNAEKGILHVGVSIPIQSGGSGVILQSINAGVAHNVVPHIAQCVLAGDTAAIRAYYGSYANAAAEFNIIETGDALTIRCIGKSAHASLPKTGVNAAAHLLAFLCGFPHDKSGAVNLLFSRIGLSCDGGGLGIKLSDTVSGDLTACLTELTTSDGALNGVLDIRYPVTFNETEVFPRLANALSPAKASVLSHHAPHYVPEASPLVQTLLSVYHDVTGKQAYCKAVGGGTYARAIPDAVTFGATFPGGPELAHQPDEYAVIDELLLNVEIIYEALKRLAG